MPVEGPARCTSITIKWKLERDREPDRLGLQVQPGSARGGNAERAPEGGAEGHPDRRDLVLGLNRAHAELRVTRELVEQALRPA